MDADELLAQAGSFGPYQKKLLVVIFFMSTVNAWGPLSVIFTLYKPTFDCTELEDSEMTANWSTMENQIWNTSESCEVQFVGNTTENHSNSNVTGEVKFVSNTTGNSSIAVDVLRCTGWEFATDEDGGETSLTEMRLICDRAYLKPLVVSLMMAGKGVGMLFCGGLSDKFGRKFVYMLTAVGSTIVMFGMSLAQDVYTFATFMILMGAFSTPQYGVLFLIGAEMVLPEYRKALGLLVAIGYGVGYALLPVFAYPAANWRWFLRIIGFGNLLTISGYWLLPETVHWLIAKGRMKQAKDVLTKIAASNGKKFAEENLMCIPLTSVEEKSGKTEQPSPKAEVPDSVLILFVRLFAHRLLRKRLLVTAFIWFSTSAIYYAVALDMSVFGGDRYLNCFLSGILEIPSIAIVYVFLNKVGRIKILTVMYAITGLACGLVPVLQQHSDVALTILVLIGKTALSGGFAAVYIHTSEECLTQSRNSFMGFCSVCARMGSVLSPYLMFMGETIAPQYVPFLVMGILGIACSLLILICLPETTGVPLPSSIQEAEKQKTLLEMHQKRKDETSEKSQRR